MKFLLACALLPSCFVTVIIRADEPKPAVKIVHRPDVVYGEVHGAGLLADVAYPEGKGPFPAIISVHGGRWVASNRRGQGVINVKQWAEMGYFAMSIEYRLVRCTPAPACYQDMLCSIRWMHANAKNYNVDPNRIFLIGMSAGGHLVSLAGTLGEGSFERTGGWKEQPHTVRGIISVAAPYDLPNLDWANLWAPAGKDGDAARKLASPIQHVSEKSAPILIVHADNDRSVPVKQANDMVDALKKAKARHRYAHSTDRGHMEITPYVVEQSQKFIDDITANRLR
jgi:alpha-L-fucosidase 2